MKCALCIKAVCMPVLSHFLAYSGIRSSLNEVRHILQRWGFKEISTKKAIAPSGAVLKGCDYRLWACDEQPEYAATELKIHMLWLNNAWKKSVPQEVPTVLGG